MYDREVETNQTVLTTPLGTHWKKILFVTLTAVICLALIRHEYYSLYSRETGLFGDFNSLWFGLLKIVLIAIGLYSSFQLFQTRKLVFGLTLFLSLITWVFILLAWQKKDERDSSPIQLRAFYDGDINGILLILRKNKSYQIGDYSIIGGTDFFGTYHISQDTIYLSEEFPIGEKRGLMGNKLLNRDGFIYFGQDENGMFLDDTYMKLSIQSD